MDCQWIAADVPTNVLNRGRMMPYIRHFEKSFLAPLYSLIRADFRDKLEQTAAHTAHW